MVKICSTVSDSQSKRSSRKGEVHCRPGPRGREGGGGGWWTTDNGNLMLYQRDTGEKTKFFPFYTSPVTLGCKFHPLLFRNMDLQVTIYGTKLLILLTNITLVPESLFCLFFTSVCCKRDLFIDGKFKFYFLSILLSLPQHQCSRDIFLYLSVTWLYSKKIFKSLNKIIHHLFELVSNFDLFLNVYVGHCKVLLF